ncbi:MAG: Ig-like domain-containing protein [Clostridia bacterium]|nr:Ig-like domain-containing protein [Clostridia bacterium]
MADKKKSKKYQYLIFALCSLLAVAACMAVLIVTVRTVEGESSGTVEYETLSKTEIKGETDELLAYLKALTQKSAKNRFIKADTYTDVSVDDNSISVYGDDNGTDKSLLIYAKNKMLGTVDGYYPEDYRGVFGTVQADMPVIDLPASLVAESRFSVGEADGDGNPVYNTDTGELIDPDYYFITLYLSEDTVSDSTVATLFSLDEKQTVAEKIKADLEPDCSVESNDIKVKELKIFAKVNRLTDEILYINFEKTYSIETFIAFENELQILGVKKIDFEYKAVKRFEYKYAGIGFAQASVTVAPGAEAALTVAAVIEDDSEYNVTFASSDEAVATVDEMGYVKGIKASDTPVTVTVTLEYLGEKFTDECTVIVSDDENNG